MRIDIKPGARRRSGDTWTRIDRVEVEGRLLRGHIETKGRRKRPEQVVTRFGNDTRHGSQPHWLMFCNGVSTDVGS